MCGIQLDLQDIKWQVENLPNSVRFPFFQFGNRVTSTNQKVMSWFMVPVKENILV